MVDFLSILLDFYPILPPGSCCMVKYVWNGLSNICRGQNTSNMATFIDTNALPAPHSRGPHVEDRTLDIPHGIGKWNNDQGPRNVIFLSFSDLRFVKEQLIDICIKTIGLIASIELQDRTIMQRNVWLKSNRCSNFCKSVLDYYPSLPPGL